jgi:outer membrane receptor protein involved in Fe transport
MKVEWGIGSMRICLLMMLHLLAGGTVFAQTGSIRLTVTDSAGEGLVVSVRLVSLATDAERRFTTGRTGELSISGVAPGRYRVEVERQGFSRQSIIIDLRPGSTVEERVALRLGTLTFDVLVAAVTPLPGSELEDWEIAPPVQGATSFEIESSQAVSLFDFLGRRSGSVNLNEIQGNPFQADLNYRGYTASPLLGTPQGISVYLDGVRLNQPFGDVVSWDLIPRQVISEVTLLPGSNPLFGLNTLGASLVLRTKDGQTHPGTSINIGGGSFGRFTGDFEHGGATRSGLNWYLASSHFFEDGWRNDSPSNLRQLFSKLGWHRERTSLGLTLGFANNSLIGNGLQEQRLLERDYRSNYTKPDLTRNRAPFVALNLRQSLSSNLILAGNGWYRSIRTATLNGDINEEALDQSLYNLSEDDRAALLAAGYRDVPASNPSPVTTPFPFWRCIAQSLQRDEPAEKCNGLLNRSTGAQQNYGFSGQLTWLGWLKGHRHQMTIGSTLDRSVLDFRQSTQLGYLTPDRGVVGVDSFADGVTGGTADGEPYDTRVDLHGQVRTFSLFATDTLTVGNRLALTLAGRYNRTTIDNRDRINPSNGASPVPGSLDGLHHFARLNPSVGLTFRPTTLVNLYFSYAEGNRAPTSVELGCADPAVPCKLPNAMAGDPPLAQVVTRTFEAGLRSSQEGRLNWNLGWFRASNRNDILFVASQQTGFGYFRNFGRTARQGFEAELSARLWRFVLGNSYTLLDATFASPELVNGESNSSNNGDGPGLEGAIAIAPGARIPLIPRHLYKAFADLQLTTRLTLNYGLQAQSRSFARGNENNLHQPDGQYYLGEGHSPGFSVSQLGASFRISRHLELYARVSNLFNQRYSTVAQLGLTGFDANGLFISRPFPAVDDDEYPLIHSTFLAPGAPRGVWGGIRLRL